MAALSTLGSSNWLISASPGTDVVNVTILNNTGGTVDLGSGTVVVMAIKVV
jgi:hypothetical protein